MINIVRKLPTKVLVAFSGGVDSVVMTHLAMKKCKEVELLFFHHGNKFADEELSFVRYFSKKYDIIVHEGYCTSPITGSKENFWRKSRYKFFNQFDDIILTGHHLDDAIEWYLMTSLQGNGKYMPYEVGNFRKPLLLTEKCDIITYATKHKLEWLDDPSNDDESFGKRNLIRNKILPMMKDHGISLKTTVRRNIISRL